jgi:CRP/FNR family cyclic AMP-dependent transcriptional regulator
VLQRFDVGKLKESRLFAAFSDEDLAVLSAAFIGRRYGKHDVLVHEGDSADALFIVVDGAVSVSNITAEGKEVILSILKAGDTFGEMGLLDAQPRSATVRALRDTHVMILGREVFMNLLERRSSLNQALLASLAQRLRETNLAVQAASYMHIDARLTEALHSLAMRFGERVDGGTKITVRLTNQQMASMVGTSRETLNRTLNRFWDEHLIDMRTGYIVIPDGSKIAQAA